MSPAIVSINSHSCGILFSNNGCRYKPVLACAGISFKNKSECMEYAMDDTKVLNHAIQSAKVSKQLAEKLCAEYLIKST
jgi:hypothetical protein